MDPLNPFANAWDDDSDNSKIPQADAANTPGNANDEVTGTDSHALPSWSQPASYEQDTFNSHADTYAPGSSKWRPASPVWQATSSPVFDKEDAETFAPASEAPIEASEIAHSATATPAHEDNDDWGQMALPKSRWEEELHKPPVWEPDAKEELEDPPLDLAPSTASIDASGEWPNQELGNEDDPWGAKARTSTSNKHGDDKEESGTAYNGDTSQDKPVIDVCPQL